MALEALGGSDNRLDRARYVAPSTMLAQQEGLAEFKTPLTDSPAQEL